MVEATRVRPDLEELYAEYLNSMKQPVAERKATRLEKLVLAFDYIMKLDPMDHSSFFWLGSYHGFSNSKIYDEQRRLDPPDAAQQSWETYCPHGVFNFIAWHRPYMLYFERALQQYDSSVMLPFWNQVSQESLNNGIPKIFLDDQFVKHDNSVIPNPLKSYQYQKNIDKMDFIRSQGVKTFRATTNIGQNLQTNVLPYVKRAMKMTDYRSFAFGSGIETPHNQAHVIIGGGGDMGDITVSAFDPIFYFHHCFYDRLFWAWQVKNSKTTKLVDGSDPVFIPFRKNDGTYHSHNSVADISQFGYDYPPLDIQALIADAKANKPRSFALRGVPLLSKDEKSRKILSLRGIDFSHFGGCFTVTAYAKTANGQKHELGWLYVFHFAKGCNNCNILRTVNLEYELKPILASEDEELEFTIKIQQRDNVQIKFTQKLQSGFSAIRKISGSILEISY